MTEKKSAFQSFMEAQVVLGVGQKLIDKMKEDFPKLKLGEPYKGKFFPYMMEYINTFIKDDCDTVIENNDDNMKNDLWQEMAFIECFCKWLEEEKGVVPIKK